MHIKHGLIAGMAVIGATGLLFHLSTESPTIVSIEQLESMPATAAGIEQMAGPQELAAPTSQDKNKESANFIRELQSRYGPHINHSKIQIKAVEKITGFLKSRYPDTWRERLANFLLQVFPKHAASMLSMFENMERYNEWVNQERHKLATLSPDEKQRLLWDTRVEIFGDEAYLIWEAALKNEAMQASLSSLGDTPDTRTFDGKVNRYLDDFHAIYGDQADPMLNNRRQELIDRFLSMKVVQEDLRDMPLAEQRAQLRSMRERMGMDKDALQRWNQLDYERAKRWDIGREYQRKREALVKQFDGEERQQRIIALQDSLFGPEAEFIRNEEATGYFRYDGEQVIGRN